jgi:hypothetical protein
VSKELTVFCEKLVLFQMNMFMHKKLSNLKTFEKVKDASFSRPEIVGSGNLPWEIEG